MSEMSMELLSDLGLRDPELEAVSSLLEPEVAIQPAGRDGFINGQHRTQAMLQAGVWRTVVVVWIDPA